MHNASDPMTDVRGDVTRLLAEIDGGSEETREELFSLVYDELHRVASGLMRRERADHTLQPTALVHEAYVRLFPTVDDLMPANRTHFFGAAANAMRQVLVDHARQRNAEKRGGNLRRVPLDAVLDWLKTTPQLEMLELDEALTTLERQSTRQHEVVMLRFFGGLRCEEIATHLEISVSTVEKDWQVARAWLYRELRG